jgi:uncharacterized membrane protein (DUF2068 family)
MGLRAIAVFEALKGIVVLLLGLGLLTFLHKDLEDTVEDLLIHLHVHPGGRLGRSILHAASHVTDAQLWGLAAVAIVYAAVRFTESWGLWHRRVWAEWFALLSGAIYLPWEVVKLIERPNAIHATLFLANAAIVLYMLYVRLDACRASPEGCQD